MAKQKNTLAIIIFFIILMCIAFLVYHFIFIPTPNSLNQGVENEPKITEPKQTEESPDYTGSEEKQYDYAIIVGSTKVAIGQIISDDQLATLLGHPISEKTNVTGPEAFPYAGITFKTNEYEGLAIIRVLAKDDHFHIYDITVTSEKFPTSLGIKIGDTVKKLKEIYPVELSENSQDDSMIYYYFEGPSSGWDMQFEISDNKIVNFAFSEVWD